jgi:deoxyribodipyrimidine photolyase-related protein
MKKLILILGDQLDINSSALRDFDPSTDEVLMVESQNESTYVWSHKAKIAIFLSAMRHFAQTLLSKKIPLTYIKESSLTIEEELKHQLIQKKVTHLVCVEPGEYRLKLAM